MQAQIQTIVLFKMKRLFIYKQKEKATTIFFAFKGYSNYPIFLTGSFMATSLGLA